MLVEPAPRRMRAALEATSALVETWNLSVAGLDLREARRQTRRRVVGSEDDRPLVVTGHQPEFIHAGVWAKHVVAARLARAVDGLAVNLIVDTDATHGAALSLPVLNRGRLRLESIQFADVRPGVTYEDIPALDRQHISRIGELVTGALGDRFERSMMGPYLEALQSADVASGYVGQVTGARAVLERDLGVEVLDRRVSDHWFGPLLAEFLANAPRLFCCYNAALAQYRRDQGIRGAQRPIPDLLRDGERMEVPLWIKTPDSPRGRLFVEQRGGKLGLFADRLPVGCLPLAKLGSWDGARESLEELSGVTFRPRALMLTLWSRMLLADLFVHGIGGAKYDRITDLLIGCYFGVRAPPMACVSATLCLDLPHHEATPRARRALLRRRRDLIWNPQRHLPSGPRIDELAAARARAVERSEALGAARDGLRAERREVFRRIRSITRGMLDLHPRVERDLDDRIRRLDQDLRENRIAAGRAYFFALHQRPALQRLRDALPAVDGFGV